MTDLEKSGPVKASSIDLDEARTEQEQDDAKRRKAVRARMARREALIRKGALEPSVDAAAKMEKRLREADKRTTAAFRARQAAAKKLSS